LYIEHVEKIKTFMVDHGKHFLARNKMRYPHTQDFFSKTIKQEDKGSLCLTHIMQGKNATILPLILIESMAKERKPTSV